MKEIKTCEDYVLAELEEKKAQIQKLTEVCKEYLEVMKNVDRCFDALKKFLTIRKASGGGELISMDYIFETYKPDEFKLLKEMFNLKVEEEE